MKPAQQIFIVRHAIAEERGDDWPDDDERPLTHKGLARMRDVVAGLRELGVEPGVILTSPLVRAVQTAELLTAGLKSGPAVQLLPALAPGGSHGAIADAIASGGRSGHVALVGHEPGLGELAAWLIGARHPLPFKKGGVCRIDVTGVAAARTGQLIWFATPAMLRGLSG